MTNKLFPCTIVGSYVQPEWLIDRKKLAGQFPPRTRMKELWRIDPEFLQAAKDDAVEMAVRDQERAGMDVVTDGEVRRESYSNHVARKNKNNRSDLIYPFPFRLFLYQPIRLRCC